LGLLELAKLIGDECPERYVFVLPTKSEERRRFVASPSFFTSAQRDSPMI
jgi:hypothetical protein